MGKGRLLKPATPAQVQLDIAAIGGLVECKWHCPPFRGDTRDGDDDLILVIPDDEEGEAASWCEARKRVEAWLLARGL